MAVPADGLRNLLSIQAGHPIARSLRTGVILNLVSRYIVANASILFDDRNISVATIPEGDPLELAFGVRALHRTQVRSLVREQILHAFKLHPRG
jgi:hypothetical protein